MRLTLLTLFAAGYTKMAASETPKVRGSRSPNNRLLNADNLDLSNDRSDRDEPTHTCLDSILAGVTMHPGDRLCRGAHSFGLSDEGDLAIWRHTTVVWSAGVCCSTAKLQADGNFVLKQDGEVVWKSRTNGKVGDDTTVVLDDTGVVYITNNDSGKITSIDPSSLMSFETAPEIVETCVPQGTVEFMRGQFLCSADSIYRFGVDLTGNLGLFYQGDDTVIWSTESSGVDVILQADGTLVLRDENRDIVWSSGVAAPANEASLSLLDDGTIAIIGSDGVRIWARSPTPPSSQCVEQVNGRLVLEEGEFICSESTQYRFGIFGGDLSLWKYQTLLWSAGTTGDDRKALLRSGGKMVVMSAKRVQVWSADTSGNPEASLRLQDDGVPRIISVDGQILWDVQPGQLPGQVSPTSVPTSAPIPIPQSAPTLSPNAVSNCLIARVSGPFTFYAGEYICSSDSSFRFGLSNGGEAVLLHYNDRKVWSAQRLGSRFVLDRFGELHLVSEDNQRVWSAGTAGTDDEVFELSIDNEGLVLVTGTSSGILWSSAAALNGRVVPDTLFHKTMTGYQGWFHAEGDGGWNRWQHWSQPRTLPTPETVTIDMWPDMTELGPDELYATGLKYANGTNATAYSAVNKKTVERHTKWMQDYGIDGLFLQRFINTAVKEKPTLDKVLANVRSGAETYGRVFSVMYDISNGDDDTMVDDLITDWMHLVDNQHVTKSSQYLHHRDRPLLAIWGLGIHDRNADYQHGQQILDWFQYEADEKYQATLMGGVPAGWRDLSRDSKTDAAWIDVYRRFDVISPWTVGRMKDDKSADAFLQNYVLPDMIECESLGIDYMPVAFPGFSSNHLSDKPFNEIPRNGGNFLWRQLYNIIAAAGNKMVYIAMFDEVDEGTAIFKITPTQEEVPIGVDLVTFDLDEGYQEDIPSDWYLTLVGRSAEYLRIDAASSFPESMPL